MLQPMMMLGLLLVASVAGAKEVCRHVDESGRVTYTDVPAGQKCEPVKMRAPANPSTYEYESARMRAESEQQQVNRLQMEERQRRPVVTYDPQRGHTAPPNPPRSPGLTIRTDPNLPDSPAPSAERPYYYNGR